MDTFLFRQLSYKLCARIQTPINYTSFRRIIRISFPFNFLPEHRWMFCFGHTSTHCIQWIHSPPFFWSLLIWWSTGHLISYARHFGMQLLRSLSSTENGNVGNHAKIAPIGHRYWQKNLSLRHIPTSISTKMTHPAK